jgi:hypothetical protein
MPSRYGSGRSGRSVGGAVVNESVGGADGSGVCSSPSTGAVTAGASVAEVEVSSMSENGPEPIGCWPKGWSGSSSTGTSPRMWTGAIGWVRAWRKPPRIARQAGAKN